MVGASLRSQSSISTDWLLTKPPFVYFTTVCWSTLRLEILDYADHCHSFEWDAKQKPERLIDRMQDFIRRDILKVYWIFCTWSGAVFWKSQIAKKNVLNAHNMGGYINQLLWRKCGEALLTSFVDANEPYPTFEKIISYLKLKT